MINKKENHIKCYFFLLNGQKKPLKVLYNSYRMILKNDFRGILNAKS
jgi:hypothetical protein